VMSGHVFHEAGKRRSGEVKWKRVNENEMAMTTTTTISAGQRWNAFGGMTGDIVV